MYQPCSENKGADQLRSHCAADLRLCFRLCRLLIQILRSNNVPLRSNNVPMCSLNAAERARILRFVEASRQITFMFNEANQSLYRRLRINLLMSLILAHAEHKSFELGYIIAESRRWKTLFRGVRRFSSFEPKAHKVRL